MRWFLNGKQYLKLIDISSPVIFKNLYIKFLFNLFLLPINYSMNNLKSLQKISTKNSLTLNYFTNRKFLSIYASAFFTVSSNNLDSFTSFFVNNISSGYLPFLFFYKNYNIRLNLIKHFVSKYKNKNFLYNFYFYILNIICNFFYFFVKTIFNIVSVFVRLLFLLVNLSIFLYKNF